MNNLPAILAISSVVALGGVDAGWATEPEADGVGVSLANAWQSYSRIVAELKRDLAKIPDAARETTEMEEHTITLAQYYKDFSLTQDLVRLVLLKSRPHAPPLVGRTRTAAPFRPLAGYPAAETLSIMGLSGVRAVLRDIETSPDKVTDERLTMYSKIIAHVLQYHSIAFLREERTHAPKSARPLYDKLLELPAIRDSKEDFVRGKPE